MKHCLTVCLSLLVLLILASDRLLAQGRQICCMSVYETLNRTVENSQYHFRAKRISTEKLKETQTTVFEVTGIHKSPDDNSIRVGQKIQVSESMALTVAGDLVSDRQFADSRQPGSAVIIVSDSAKFSEDAFVLCEADERVLAYLDATAAALKGITDDKARIPLFFPYLESECDVAAADALAEVFANGYEGLSAVRDKLPRDLILRKFANPDTPESQLGRYGVLVGLCGRAEDAAALEIKIVILDEDFRLGIEGVMAGYLLIRGESGLTVLEDAKFRARMAMTTDGKEVQQSFSETYALMQALRFIWDFAPDRISKERLRQSMRLMLDRPELSDLAITDLSRWKDWSLHDRVMLMYDDKELAFPATRRAIVRYLLQSSREKGEVGSDGKTTRPAHAIKADQLLKTLEEKDPKTVADVKHFLRPIDP